MLVKKAYQANPLRCPRCGGTMKIVALIDAHQRNVIHETLDHCGLWKAPPSGAPPQPHFSDQPQPGDMGFSPDAGLTYEVAPDFLEYAHCGEIEQPELPWEA